MASDRPMPMYGEAARAIKRDLTEAEWKALCAVDHFGRDGWPVAVREVQEYGGWASSQTPHSALVRLAERKLLETSPRARRANGWRLTEDGRAVVNA